MRILTPENAAFSPSGSGGSLVLAATYELVESVNADFGPTTATFFAPSDGLYIWALFSQTTIAAGAGNLTVSLYQPLQAVFTVQSVSDLSVVGGAGYDGATANQPVLAMYGDMVIDRTVSALAAGPATYRITAAAYRLC